MKTVSNCLHPILLAAAVASTCSLLHTAPAQAVNLIVNGNFQTNSFSGWTLTGDTAATFIGAGDNGSSAVANLGTNAASPITAPPTSGFLSQSIATTNNTRYRLQYDLLSFGDIPSLFETRINNVVRFSQTNIPRSASVTTTTFDFTGTGSSTAIEFKFQDVPGYFQLDNVSLDLAPPVAVPEPFTIVGTLIGGTAALRMKNKIKSLHNSNEKV